jgi:PAS domain S-box-containing protein
MIIIINMYIYWFRRIDNLMKDKSKTKAELIRELEEMRRRTAELESAMADLKKDAADSAFVYNAISDYITAVSPDFRILSYNKTVERQFGKDLKGRLCYEAYQGRDGVCPDCAVKKAIETRAAAFTFQPATEISIPVEIYAYPVLDEGGEITAVVEHGRDVTEKLGLMETLRESEERFRKFFEGAPDAMFLADPESGIILDANPAASRLMQRPHEEIVGLHQAELHPHRMEGHSRRTFKEHAVEKKGLHPVENVVVRPDGAEVPIEVLAREITLNGKTVLLGTFRDITERKQAEEELKRSLNEKEVLLREVHHRVKNNLAVINSLLRLQLDYADDPKTVDMMEESRRRIRSMALVHEKLYQSKDFSHIDIYDYLLTLVQTLFGSYDITTDKVIFDIDADAIQLSIDTIIPFGLMVNELVTNSLKHAFKDGRKGRIDVSLTSDGEGKTLVVSDNGLGIPDEIDIYDTRTLGFQLVNALAKQIMGDVELDRSSGTRITIAFKKD